MKNCEIFLVFAQNIDCGYSLEPPQFFKAKKRKNVYPCKPQFYYQKVGCKWVFIKRTCYPGDNSRTGCRLTFSVLINHHAYMSVMSGCTTI